MTENTKLEFLAIRYLGWIGEALALGSSSGTPDVDAVRTAGQCCDRIEHIAQYALAGDNWSFRANGLVGDVRFMEAALVRHAYAFSTGLPLNLPSSVQLGELLLEINVLNAIAE